jgi:beclin
MEDIPRCYYCKIKVTLQDDQFSLIPINLIKDLIPYNSEKIIEIDRILYLSSVSHPKQLVCLNCLENLFPPIEKEINEANLNKKSLEDQLELFKKELEQEIPDDSDESLMIALESKLRLAKSESESLNEELFKLQQTLSDLKKDEHSYWVEANRTEMDLLLFEEDHSEITQRLKVAEDELKYLSNINVLNELFYISTSNQFGTISGLRLGKLDSDQVSWDEINAGWGHCVLLLSTLFRIKGYASAQCYLYPLGNFSKIAQVHDPDKKFELFITEPTFSKAVSKYNFAQELFLEVIYELSLLLEGEFPRLSLPVKIERNFFTVNNVKIKLDASNKETWTRGLKYMLQDLKYLIYVCIREDNV